MGIEQRAKRAADAVRGMAKAGILAAAPGARDALGEVARIVEDLAHEIEILRARVAAVEGRK